MTINLAQARKFLNDFDFHELFIEVLGWSKPSSKRKSDFEVEGTACQRYPIAQLSGVVVFEIICGTGHIPDARLRLNIHKEIFKLHHENLLIFVDKPRSQSLWYWVKRQEGKTFPREHLFVKGQPGDLFLSKLGGMVFDISEFDDSGNIPLVEVTGRLKKALDVERVTKDFYVKFDAQHIAFLELIQGIPNEHQRRWYASVLLNRMMFIYFLQRKSFLDLGDIEYLQHKLAESKKQGKNLFFGRFLKALFFEGFAKPEEKRSAAANKLLGKIKYLNGGLFLPHTIEQQNPDIDVPDKAFENLLDLFSRYSWNLNDSPAGADNEINPDVLGYIFEKYINQKAFGAYYTRTEITEYLCEKTIHHLVLDQVHDLTGKRFESVADLLLNLDAHLCHLLLREILPKLTLLDPACGSGAFLVAAMKTLINLYAAAVGKIKFLADRGLTQWLNRTEKEHRSIHYYIKKTIITENLFGVDLMEEATEIARLRLFLALVAAAESVDDLEPLPNIDFNILSGNSLIGLLRVQDKDFENRTANLFRKSYRDILLEKNRLIETYRHTASFAQDLTALRESIEQAKAAAVETLDEILLAEFQHLGLKFSQATWDDKKNTEGKPIKRPLAVQDLQTLHPFHWGYEFDEVLNQRGGFDAIITNPPWETFQPDAKEFFSEYSEVVTKKKMDIKEFDTELRRLLNDKKIKAQWLAYHSQFNHQREYFRLSPQYSNQVPIIDGRRHGKDINLFKLFVEQCFNLLRPGGQCGIVIPSGIYTDLGTKQLREMLFSQAKITGLFGIENRKQIFEGVDSRFKFVVLTFEKGGQTKEFPAAFMRHDVSELDRFPQQGAINISVPLIRKLSPDSLSIMEYKDSSDILIVKKMIQFPLLGEKLKGLWNIELHREFNMTDDAYLFHKSNSKDMLPLFEGKMIWQFSHILSEPRFWIPVKEGRAALLGNKDDYGQILGHEKYRLAYRSIASNTNERTLIASVIPPCFTGNSLNVSENLGTKELLFCVAFLNSFSMDWLLRIKVTTNINMFYVYQLPVPRLTAKDKTFGPIVERAARLICTTAEFDALAKEVGLKNHKQGAIDPAQRARLRAELDGLIAHLYGLTEEEFAYILTTFPLVPDPIKLAAHNAYRDVEKGLI